jgi:hypothetical protein
VEELTGDRDFIAATDQARSRHSAAVGLRCSPASAEQHQRHRGHDD